MRWVGVWHIETCFLGTFYSSGHYCSKLLSFDSCCWAPHSLSRQVTCPLPFFFKENRIKNILNTPWIIFIYFCENYTMWIYLNIMALPSLNTIKILAMYICGHDVSLIRMWPYFTVFLHSRIANRGGTVGIM